MKTRTTVSARQGLSAAGGAAVALLALAVAAPVMAEGSNSQALASTPRIEGVWGVTVTVRHCETGAPLGLPFQTLHTYHEGAAPDGRSRRASGTVSISVGSLAFAPNQRSEGHGVWAKLGPGTFRQRTITLIRFETAPQPPLPGFLAGWEVIEQVITMLDEDEFNAEGTSRFYDTQGELYRSGCSTTVGQRFE
ncbi:MAG TPA: hypothetical protein VMT85_00620 [Thermoanaerobaculia bacterium]|nr:hypothetical protein [Thermoanaerobaculia bacterium]